MSKRFGILFPLLLVGVLTLGASGRPAAPVLEPREAPAPGPEGWVDSVLSSLSLEEKVAQMLMIGAFGHYVGGDADIAVQLESQVKDRKIGGLILRQSDVYEAAHLLNRLQRLAKVPLLISADFERGAAMRVRRTTPIPDAMAIGATRSADLAYQAGFLTGVEARAIGVHQNYAPVADVNVNALNPVINTRAFGDNVDLVRELATAYVRGSQDAGVLATLKHFPGHGDTQVDSHLDLPVIPGTRERLDRLELPPFKGAIEQGARSVMIAHLQVPAINGKEGLPTSLSAAAIDTVLRRDLGFGGLVVTDAMEMRGVVRGFSTARGSVMAVKAGIDIVLMPPDEDVSYNAILAAARSGEIPRSRIDEAVRRILTMKQWAGLDRSRVVALDSIPSLVATNRHRSIAREIARRAITLLRNENAIPFAGGDTAKPSVVILNDTDDPRTDINRPGPAFPSETAGSYFLQEIQRRLGPVQSIRMTPGCRRVDIDQAAEFVSQSKRVVVAVNVRVRTSSGRITIPESMSGFIDRLARSGTPHVVVLFGNPYVAPSFPSAKAILCAYGETEPQIEASVEALFGEIPIGGKLPVMISEEFPYGAGLSVPQKALRLEGMPVAGVDPAGLRAVDQIILKAIADSAFPAAQIAVVRGGTLLYSRAYGTYTYDLDAREIDGETLFDLASVTKVIATTTAVMKLYGEGRLGLEDPVGKYLPAFAQGEKASITVRHLLTHRGGFPPFRKFWEFTAGPRAMLDSIDATPLVARPGDSTIYSDLGMITLMRVVEKAAGQSLDAYMQAEFFGPLGMRRTMYRPPPALADQCAPTEIDSAWRKTLVRGRVHDENADFLGGVSGHAGLFSTGRDLAVFMQMILNGGEYGGRRYLVDTVVQRFTREPQPGERLLGWDVKSPKGSSAGTLFGPASFGHTGFTGTSIWVDPERELSVILLTNRVCPTRANSRIFAVRPAVHDAVVRALRETEGTGR